MKHIGLAHTPDAQEISGIRADAFSRSSEFTLVQPEKLEWDATDEAHTVLGIWNRQDQVVATLRLIPVADRASASTIIETKIPEGIAFPALVFNRAATRRDFQRQGLNQLLRYYAIQSALESGIKSLLSPVYESAPRIAFMKKLGYSCHALPHSWQTKLVPKSPRILCVLKEKHFNTALETIRAAIGDLIQDYPWQGPRITAP